jgi:hypothetical protein
MRIIGGGYSRDTIEMYTTEAADAYNIPSVSDVSLIWNVTKILPKCLAFG